MYKKKVLSIFVLLLLSTKAYTQSIEVVFEQPIQLINKSVGKEWSFYYSINDIHYSLYSKAKIEVDKTAITLKIYAREEDKIPDIGSSILTIDPKELEINTTNRYVTIIHVIENGGKYKGNEAQWKMYFSINYMKQDTW